jgi:tetrahydromethanopterin S-methyltransferase subunit G
MTQERKRTDDRIGDLDKKVAVGFATVGERFNAVDQRFDAVTERFKTVDERFDKVDERFDNAQGDMNEVSRHLGKKTDRLTYLLLAAALGYIATHGL